MADKKITSNTTDFTIPGKADDPKTKNIVIKLPQRGKYDVYQKDFPANLPQKYTDSDNSTKSYTWINNFGLKARKNDPNNPGGTLDTSSNDLYSRGVDEYIIELDDVDGKEPVYFDGTSVNQFKPGKVNVGNNRIQVTLTLGDPPIGWG